MDAYIIGKDTPLHPDRFGVLTPNPLSCKKAEPKQIRIIFVPGVAFDPKGNRLGFGKGYYDRFLPRTEGIKIALAYDFQIVSALQQQQWDVPMDFIITETRVIDCRG